MLLNNITSLIPNFGSLISNPWVVGIGAGTVSGLIVLLITRKLFSTRENKEYVQKVLSANAEVLYALRPLISESAFPSSAIVDSVISATSRKFAIKKESMNTPMQFFDDLTKEVMDSNFIPPKKKTEYCKHLHELKTEAQSLTQPREVATDLNTADIERRDNLFNALSMTMALMVGLTTVSLLTFKDVFNNSVLLESFGNIIFPFVAALVTSLFVIAVSLRRRDSDNANYYKKILGILKDKDNNKEEKK